MCRATAVLAGGICGLHSTGQSNMADGAAIAGAIVWLLIITALSPEFWHYTKLRCGHPLVFGARDDRRRLERSPGYEKLRSAGLIPRRPEDVWSEGCVRYFAFAFKDDAGSQVATFQVGPAGVLGRILRRPTVNASADVRPPGPGPGPGPKVPSHEHLPSAA